ncbi:glycosyltransferase family 39 protein [Paenisporosarcina sp. OV554]|uniref:glycosyltransferase family 39 protein n=1 Tax=Paenisporosarcina sp. OV554 TaxID=2135694 RepID=UPI000D3B0666|nr:glycosyltransferase family 39 protein [Paenisporosarcina sp. OV554]PUB05906.1 dolichyl-phosphate-mannose-protein mannosyltransferase [Paenisporosarcina sp. OV554]
MNKRLFIFIKSHYWLVLIVVVGFLLRIGVIVKYGSDLSLNSDDMGYVKSALTLLETGMLTYHKADMATVHIMPGQSFLLALIFLLFGKGSFGILMGKFIFIVFGTFNIFMVYKIGKIIGNRFIGLLSAAMLAVFIPQILTDNLFITEAPFMLALLLLVYYSIKLANEPSNWKYFCILMLSYLVAIMFKATFALYPILLLFYFILKKYPIKIGLKQFGVAAVMLLVILGPWWIRNYVQFGDFIPLTGGGGNPLLLGTYQGAGINYGEPYVETVNGIKDQYPIKGQNAYFNLQVQNELAKERIKVWWADDKESFLMTYMRIKPILQWNTQFYWVEIYGFSKSIINSIHQHIVGWSFLSLFALFFMRHRWREYVLLVGIVVYNLIFNSVFYAFPRYNQPLMFILFIIISTAVFVFYQILMKVYAYFQNRKSEFNSLSSD